MVYFSYINLLTYLKFADNPMAKLASVSLNEPTQHDARLIAQAAS